MTSAGAHLLVIDDDDGIRSGLVRALTGSGFECTAANDVASALAVDRRPDLVLLDLGLPDGDGLDLARDLLVRWPDLAIIMLTARAEEMDIVVGLDVGAVDYITKPFRLAELLARVRAQLRRPVHRAGTTLTSAGVEVDLGARVVTLHGRVIELRAKEFDLLVALMERAGNVVTREDLMSEVWDEHWFGSTKTLDVHIAALRRRLDEAPGEPSRITALRGVGYRWERDG